MPYTLEDATQYEQKGDFVSAVKAYVSIINADWSQHIPNPSASMFVIFSASLFQQTLEIPRAKQAIERLSNNPNIPADTLNLIGGIYYDRQEYAQAKLWYEKAKEKGCLAAYKNLGVVYEYTRDFVIAAKYYRQAIEKEFVQAQEELNRLFEHALITSSDLNAIGCMYHDGKDVKQDFEKAKTWYEKAKEKGSAAAYRNLGVLHEYGFGVNKNFLIAAKFYQQAIEKGHAEAQKDLDRLLINAEISAHDLDQIGVMYANADNVARDYTKARQWQEKAKEKGCAAAYRNLGILYENGWGVEQNRITAAKLYQQAIDKGYAAAQADLDRLLACVDITTNELNLVGGMYYDGKEVNKAFDKAKLWYEKAKEKSCAAAYKNLGLLYEFGLGVEKNFFIAAKFYQQALEKGCAEAQRDLDRLFTSTEIGADTLNSIGVMYHDGQDIKADQVTALRWFEKAKEKGCAVAYRNLGFSTELGLGGLTKSLVTAAMLYQQAIDKGYAAAQADLDRLLTNPALTADELVTIGDMYDYGNKQGIKTNYDKSRSCYERATQKGSAIGYRKLAAFYQYDSCGVRKDLLMVAQLHQQAIDKGDALSPYYLDSLFKGDKLTADQLNLMAIKYYEGKVVKQDFAKAKLWYEKAKEKGCAVAYRNLGQLYEEGAGVTKDIPMAAKLYQQAIEKGYPEVEAKKDFDRLCGNPAISPETLIDIGEIYRHGEGIRQDFVQVKLWYEKAKEKGCALAYKKLGTLYEEGLGVEKNFVMAAKFYQQAIEKGHVGAQEDLNRLFKNPSLTANDLNGIGRLYQDGKEIKQSFNNARKWYEGAAGRNIPHAKKQLKELERDRIIALPRDEKGVLDVDVRDERNRTALHRAARDGKLKNCARLLFLRADKNIYDEDSNKPFSDLSAAQQEKVGRLQTNLSKLIEQLEEKAPPILAGRIQVDDGCNRRQVEAVLDTLYKSEQIKPLLDLAKLAALGLHDLSGREKFSTIDYDSDNDDDEKLNADGRGRLRIRPDAKSETVQQTYHAGKDGLFGMCCHGVYPHKTNDVHVGGGKSRTREEVRSTLIHELTHFLLAEIFNNKCKPYRQDDKANSDTFTVIANNLESKKDTLDPILQRAFNPLYKRNNQIHDELLVRVPEMILAYPNGLARLQKQAPELLKYYTDVVLPAVIQHTQKLEKRALGGFPLELFTQSRRHEFSLHM